MKRILIVLLCMFLVSCIPEFPQGIQESSPQEKAEGPAAEPIEPEPEVKIIEEPKEDPKPTARGSVKLYKISKYAQIEITSDGRTESFILKTSNREDIIREVMKRYDVERDNIELSFSEEEQEEKSETTRTQKIINLMNSKVKSYSYIKEDLPFAYAKVYVRENKVKVELKEPEGTDYFKRREYAKDSVEDTRKKAKEGEEYFVNLLFLDKLKGDAKGVCTLYELYVSCEWLEGVVQKLPWKVFGIKLPVDWLNQFKNTEPTRVVEAGGYINGVDTNLLVYEEGDRITRIWTHATFGVPQQVEVEYGGTRNRATFRNMIINGVSDEEVADPVAYDPEK